MGARDMKLLLRYTPANYEHPIFSESMIFQGMSSGVGFYHIAKVSYDKF